ncbi:F-box only protein 31-like [Myotis myotis]|uniref:F-box only protein 31-like n=1 Tax=Myotis myotis TaxID=51298 RepID=UPI001748887A|nr:F-box only protein 31-like [Myotis myotis]
MEECACICGLSSLQGCRCSQQSQSPAEMAAAEGKPAPALAPAQNNLEADRAAGCCWGSGGIQSPMRPPPPLHCSLQDLPVEMLVEIFAQLPGTDLLSLAQVCTKFHRILHTDSIWRQRCRKEFGVPEDLQNLEMIGMSYREVYLKLFHPYRHILGLWQLDSDYRGNRGLLNVVVDGVCITGWMYSPGLNTHVPGPIRFQRSFRIRLTERKTAVVECMAGRLSRAHHRHLQIWKDRFTMQCKRTDRPTYLPRWLRRERRPGLVQKDRHHYDCLTSRRLYLPPHHPDDLIRPGLFQGNCDIYGLTIVMLSFHGKYASVTQIMGNSIERLEIHLMRRIQLPGGEFFRNFRELSRVVRKIDKQVIREQQQQQQQQEDRTEESEGHGWQSRAQPSVRELGAAVLEEQPVPFVLPVGVYSRARNYPRTCRMCFYGVDTVTSDGFTYPRGFPGVFILFDENHFGFICLYMQYFMLYCRVHNTFQNVEAPSPQAFLDMLKNIQY